MPRPVARTPGNHEPASTTGLGSGLPAELASAEPRQVREHSPADSPPTASTSASLTPGPRPTRSRPTGRRAGRNRPRARGALRTSRRSGATLRPARRASAMCAGNTCRPTQASARVSICVRATLTRARALVARTNVRARTRARAHTRCQHSPQTARHRACEACGDAGWSRRARRARRKPEISPGVPVPVGTRISFPPRQAAAGHLRRSHGPTRRRLGNAADGHSPLVGPQWPRTREPALRVTSATD